MIRRARKDRGSDMNRLSISDRFLIPTYIDPNQMVSGLLEFSDSKCKRCGVCTYICPARSIVMDKASGKEKPLPRLNDIVPGVSACIACGCCVAACPEGAISIKRGFYATKFYTRLHQTKTLSAPKKY